MVEALAVMELELPRLSIEADVSGVRFLTDPALEGACGVRMGFTERGGGLSPAPYDSLNLGRFAGEGEDAALANMTHLMTAVGASKAHLINPTQVHGADIVTIKGNDPSDLQAAREAADAGADALVVDAQEVFALLGFADCLPLIMVAPTGAFAVAHSGWRGTYARIASKTLKALGQVLVDEGAFASRECAVGVCNIYVGPYIHGECFEVGPDTYDLFAQEFGDAVLLGEHHVDLGAAVRADLTEAGADPSRIADAGLCTVCNVERFFSYRAENGTCGRHGAFAYRKRG